MPVNAAEVFQVCLVRDSAMTHENLVVDDRGQRQPAEYVAIQSYQFRSMILCDKRYIDTVHNNNEYNK